MSKKEGYSFTKAGINSALSMGAMGLAGIYNAAVLHAGNHFGTFETAREFASTFAEAFAYVAQPGPVAIAAGISVVIGAGIEAINWHNRTLDRERGKLPTFKR